MATKAIKHFRLRELARAPPAPVLQPNPTTTKKGAFDVSKFNLSQPTPVAPTPEPESNLPKRTNPFLPWRNPKTGRWAPPKYSLRQQADLIKKARASGNLAMLPPSPKTSAAHLTAVALAKARPVSEKPVVQSETPVAAEANTTTNTDADAIKKGSEEWWTQPVEWVGEFKERSIPGSDIGNRLYAGKKRMFKGHKWERVAKQKAAKRRMLMRDMAKRIQRFKNHHKRRRPDPLKPSKQLGGKLPF